MDYLLFNNEIFISDGKVVSKIDNGSDLKDGLGPIENARLCCVDVDVMIASAPQDYLDKKDNLLARKFGELYPGEYIIQDEKIDNNIFQVIGIKAERVKEIYSLIPRDKVDAFVPYAMALRSLLVDKKTDMTRMIVFLDDLGEEKLITVFEGLKFSRTRTIYTDKVQDILPDIKRSLIDFTKKLGEFMGHNVTGDFTIVTNSKYMAAEIKLLEMDLSVDLIDSQFPALDGLRSIDPIIKYRLREDVILDRQKNEREGFFRNVIMSIGICACGALFFCFNQVQYAYVKQGLAEEQAKNDQFQSTLDQLDPFIYRESIKKPKNIDYSSVLFELMGVLPPSYEISSLKFTNQGNRRVFEAYVLSSDDGFYDSLPRARVLKDALINDVFIHGRPGKYLRIDL